jgi:ATP-dependent Zn protease
MLEETKNIVERFVDNYFLYGFDQFERENSSQVLYSKKETYIHAELDRYYARVKRMIAENVSILDRITEALLEKKTITGADVRELKIA